MGSCCTPRPLPLCSRERRRVRDGRLRRTLSRGLLHPSSWLASSSPLSVSGVASRHLSPPNGLFRSSSLHLFSPCIVLSFLSSFFFCPLSVCVSLPLFLSLPLSLCFWWTNWQWHRRSVWRQGLPIPATCLGFFALSCILSHDAKETQMIYIQSIFLLTACSFCHALWYCLLITFSLLLWCSHPSPLTLSAGYELNLLSRPTVPLNEQTE